MAKTQDEQDKILFNTGITEGKLQLRQEVLGFLQTKYMDSPLSMQDPEMIATLKVARELSEFLKNQS